MGCVGSKGKKGGDDGAAAGGDYATIGVEKFDEIFGKAKSVSEKGAALTDGLDGQKMVIFKNTGMEWLKEPSLAAALKSFIYSCGCDAKDPENFKPDVKMEDPYVEFPEDLPLTDTNKETKEAVSTYFKTLVGAPETLKAITEEMQGVMESANAAKDTASDDFSSLGMMEKAKAAKNLAANMKKLKAAQEDLGKIPETLKTATEDAKNAAAGVPDAVKTCKETAEKVKALTGDDAKTASRITKEILPGDKNDQAAADAYSKKTYKAAKAEAKEEAADNKV